MKRLKLAALLCAAVACASLLLVGCQSQEYTPPSKEQTIPATALGTPGTLRVGVNASSAPLAGQTSSSTRIVGIDVDVAAYMADQMGLKLEVIDVSNNFAQALSEGKIDIALGVDASEEGTGYWKSAPYLQTGVALFGTAAESAVPTTDSKPTIAAQASSKSSWRVTNLYGDQSLAVQNDLRAAFEALNTGSVRYVAADAVIGTYVAYSSGFDDKIIALLQDPSGYCAAVSEKNTELQNAIAANIDKMVNGGIMNIIESKWLGTPLNLANMTVVKAANDKKDDSKSKDAKKEEKKSESGDEKKSEASAAAAEPAQEEAPAEAPVEEVAQDGGQGEAEAPQEEQPAEGEQAQ